MEASEKPSVFNRLYTTHTKSFAAKKQNIQKKEYFNRSKDCKKIGSGLKTPVKLTLKEELVKKMREKQEKEKKRKERLTNKLKKIEHVKTKPETVVKLSENRRKNVMPSATIQNLSVEKSPLKSKRDPRVLIKDQEKNLNFFNNKQKLYVECERSNLDHSLDLINEEMKVNKENHHFDISVEKRKKLPQTPEKPEEKQNWKKKSEACRQSIKAAKIKDREQQEDLQAIDGKKNQNDNRGIEQKHPQSAFKKRYKTTKEQIRDAKKSDKKNDPFANAFLPEN